MLRSFLLAVALTLGAVGSHAQEAATAGSAVGFDQAISPATIGPGSEAAVTFTIQNVSGVPVTDLAFTNTLPAGVTVAAVSNATTSCTGGARSSAPPTVSAPSGGTTLTFSGGSVAANATCTVTVNVTSDTPGTASNVTGTLTHSMGSTPAASADLTVDTALPGLSKSFSPASVSIGGRSTLTLTIDNSLNGSGVANLDVTDVLPQGMVIADPARASTTCGTTVIPPTLTAVAGTQTIVLDANGFAPSFLALEAGGTCTVTVDVEATGGGALANVSSSLLADFVDAGFASAVLTATAGGLLLTKSFLDDPVPPGGTVDLVFTIRNLSRSDAATALAFDDDLGAALPGLTASALLSNDCGGTVSGIGTTVLSLSGAALAAEGSCALSVRLLVPSSTPPGEYTNTTTAISGTVGGVPLVGNPAVADLFVEPVPVLVLDFVDDPVVSGSDVTVRYTVTNTSLTGTLTGATFQHRLTEILPFPVSVTLPPVPDPPCGPGSSLSLISAGTDEQALQLTGGTLDPGPGMGASCTFEVMVTVPEGVAAGDYMTTTTGVSGTVDMIDVVGDPASDVLSVLAGPSLTKAFLPASVARGETTRLEFALQLSSDAPSDATSISFTDNLAAVLAGLAPAAGQLPLAACGGTLDIAMDVLDFSGGALTPGETCTFGVDLAVPGDAAYGTFPNTTSQVNAVVDGIPVVSAEATADLTVTPIEFLHVYAFLDPAAGTGSLGYIIRNSDASPATISSFSHNLTPVLAGLTASETPITNTCGSTVSILSGGEFVFVTDGTVPASESCAIALPITFPPFPDAGSYQSVTGALTTSFGTTPPSSATLTIGSVAPLFSKAFGPSTLLAGEISTLTFTIDNSAQDAAATSLAFTDTLPTGVEIAGTPNVSTTCTGGSIFASPGGGLISYSGGSVAAEAVCTLAVDVTAAGTGVYVNTSDALTASSGTSDPATATLTVVDPPLYASKTVAFETDADGDGFVDPGDVLLYTVEIRNRTGSAMSGVAFTDTPDALSALEVGSVTTTAGSITGGNGTGDTAVAVSVGTLAASGSETVTFRVSVPGPIADAVEAVCNQGQVEASMFRPVRTDDPATGPFEDPTCAPHQRPVIDLVITDVVVDGGGMTMASAAGGTTLEVLVSAENTTDERITYRRRLVLTDPTGRRTPYPAPRERLSGGGTAAASPVSGGPVVLPSNAPFGEYTVTVLAVVLNSLEVVDTEETTFLYFPAMGAPQASLEDVRTGAGPNPFTDRTTLRFAVEETSTVDLRVFDVTGREVAVLASGELPRGVHEIPFEGADRPAGVYVWRLIVDGEQTTGSVTLVR